MTTTEWEKKLGETLYRMYHSGESKVAMIHLFGILFADKISNLRLNKKSIIEYAKLTNSYHVEIQKGISLSKYVVVKDEYQIKVIS